jgi:hypothetical protein
LADVTNVAALMALEQAGWMTGMIASLKGKRLWIEHRINMNEGDQHAE